MPYKLHLNLARPAPRLAVSLLRTCGEAICHENDELISNMHSRSYCSNSRVNEDRLIVADAEKEVRGTAENKNVDAPPASRRMKISTLLSNDHSLPCPLSSLIQK